MIVKFKDLFDNDIEVKIDCFKEYNDVNNDLKSFLKSLEPIKINMIFFRKDLIHSMSTDIYNIIKYNEYCISFSDEQLNYLIDTYHDVYLEFDYNSFNIIIKNLNAKRKKLHLKKEIPFDRYYEVIY